MRQNTDPIYEAITKVEEISGVRIEFDSSRPEYDGLVQVEGHDFFIVFKPAVRSSNLGLVIAQIEQIQQSSRRPLILVSKYISKSATEAFKTRNISYIDTAGNAWIKKSSLFLLIEGQKAKSKNRTNQSRAFQEAGLKILFTFLSYPESLQQTYREIAKRADVSTGSLSNVMQELEDLNYILRTDTKRVLKNREDLIERWMVAFHENLKPRVLRKRMRFVHAEQRKNWDGLIESNLRESVFWGGEPGAVLLGAQLRPEAFIVYTNNELPELAKAFQLVPDEKGSVEVRSQFWTAADELQKAAPWLLIYSDLMNTGSGRNIEIANQILEDAVPTFK